MVFFWMMQKKVVEGERDETFIFMVMEALIALIITCKDDMKRFLVETIVKLQCFICIYNTKIMNYYLFVNRIIKMTRPTQTLLHFYKRYYYRSLLVSKI